MKAIISIALIFILSFTIAACKQKHKVQLLPNDEIYSCPLHVHVLDDHPAKCPEDGTTDLIRKKITEEQREMLKSGNFVRAKE